MSVFLFDGALRAAEAVACALLLCRVPGQTLPDIPTNARHAWMALLHYWDDDGEWRSDVEDPSFFLDADASRHPEQEWQAARRAFLLPADGEHPDQHAQCRFPARFVVMKESLGWSDADVPTVVCPELADHQLRLNATSLSVVFASHYLNNPASAFGHTMLYLGSDSERSVLLADYSVSFEADVEGMSPASYLPRGLFGGLLAGYRLAPLHERVRKYQRDEQRDLWLFPLQVTQHEIDQLVRHLWELKDVTFRYGFFGGNCAQRILGLVHAVAPRYDVLPYRRPAVLPSEVVRRLVEQIGLASDPVRRPSQWSRYNRLVATLSSRERAQLEEMVSSRTVVVGASPAALSAALLWSEIETPYRAFRRAAESANHDDLIWKRALWASRVVGAAATEDDIATSFEASGPSLLQGHRPSRLTLRGGHRRGSGSVLHFGARWLLHSPVDPHVGQPPVSNIEVALVDLGVSAAGELWVDEATVLRVERLAPASALQSALAWKIDVGGRRLVYDGESRLSIGVEVGIGFGASYLRQGVSVAAYTMVGVRPGAALASEGISFLPAGIWSGGLLLRLPGDVRTRFSGEYALSIGTFDGGAAALHVVGRKGLTRDLDLEAAAAVGPGRSFVTLGVVSFH